MEETTLYTPRSTQVKLLLLAAVFTAIGFWLVNSDDSGFKALVGGYAAIVFAGVCTVFALDRLVHRRPVLRLDRIGITDRASMMAAGRLSWYDIAAVRVITERKVRMLAVYPRDPEACLTQAGLLRNAAMRLSRRLGYPMIAVPEGVLPYSLERLIIDMRRHNPSLVVLRSS